ncbi:MAG: disulfide bond formation protein B [Hyphomicrobiales bacterium]|nr:disulfide bond formation protein B [Hyphomicrobiales bacterium]MDE2116174.1 disulfide bond formation protein B [Hyphomicrobiales bacterium]
MGQWTTPRRAAIVIFLVAFATIAGAWIYQANGYAPCELCLKERIPYYIGVPLAALVFGLASRGAGLARAGLWALALLFVFSSAFGIYHTGVEHHLWAGPTACTGDFHAANSMAGFMQQLQTVKVVRCDVVSVRVFGLSMALWNAIISAGLAVLAVLAARQPVEG